MMYNFHNILIEATLQNYMSISHKKKIKAFPIDLCIVTHDTGNAHLFIHNHHISPLTTNNENNN